MKQYLDLVRDVIDNGTLQGNRTGIRTISLPGAMLRFDLQKGFPAITTRKLAFKSAIGEMGLCLPAPLMPSVDVKINFHSCPCSSNWRNANAPPPECSTPRLRGASVVWPKS